MNYIVFPYFDNKELGKVLFKRALELGYKSKAGWTENSLPPHDICLESNDRTVHYWSLIDRWDKKTEDGNAKLGNFYEFLFTDKYKVKKEPIKVQLTHKYTAEVSDVIKVGCQEFPVSKLTELVEAVERYNHV